MWVVIKLFLFDGDDLKFWLDKKLDYSVNSYLKACYGTFLSACMVICCHDQNADTFAPDLNVTWTRDKPTLVMNGLTQNQTYIHTPDASMGMNIHANSTTIYEPPFLESVYDHFFTAFKIIIRVMGDLYGWDTSKIVKFVDKIQKSIKWIVLKFLFVREGDYHMESGEWKEKAFRFACSSSLSPIEDKILQFERFPVNSVLLGLGQKVNNGTVLNIEDQGSNVLIHTVNDTNTRISIDSNTMLAKEIIGDYKGSKSTVPAYCFYDYQTGRDTTWKPYNTQ